MHWLSLSLTLCEIHWEKGRSEGFAMSDPLIHWSIGRVEGSIPFARSTSPPLILNGLQPRYSSVRLLILTTDSMSLIWDLTFQLCALISVLLHQLMDLLLLFLSKSVHLIGLLRSEQSSSFINVDVALTLLLNVIVTHRFTSKYWFECTLKWFDLII